MNVCNNAAFWQKKSKRPEYQIDLIISFYVNKTEILNKLLHNLRKRIHTTRVLPDRLSHLADSNFIARVLLALLKTFCISVCYLCNFNYYFFHY